MYKILVVDDEPLQVKTLASILKNMRPAYEVFEASDGKEALDHILSNTPDVIITDLRMPVMGGLEMIEEISQSGDMPEVVILSGYSEFKYAQKAINFGVFEYMLKPISKLDIEGILSRLEKKLEQKKSQHNQKYGMLKKLENTFPVYIEHQLNRWLNNNLDESGIEEISEIFPFKGYGNILVTRIGKYKRMSLMYNIEELERFLQHFKFTMKQVLDSIGHSISFFSEKSHDIMITILTSQNDFYLKSGKNEKMIKVFIDTMKNDFGLNITVGVGNKSTNILHDLASCYEQAAQAEEYNFIVGNKEIAHFSDINTEKAKDRPDIYAFEEELSGIALKTVDNMTAKAINDTFDKYIEKLNFIKPQKLKECLYYVAMNKVKTIKNLLVDEHYDVLVESMRDSIFESDNYTELKFVFIDIMIKSNSYINNKENKNNFIVIQKCKHYIEENYMEDLSLEVIAGKFHFSPSYFSNIFKNYAGVGFSEYLTAVRIKEAQHLLKITSYKVYDISEKVGYKDPTYFNRIFKKEVGISPYKFRQIASEF